MISLPARDPPPVGGSRVHGCRELPLFQTKTPLLGNRNGTQGNDQKEAGEYCRGQKEKGGNRKGQYIEKGNPQKDGKEEGAGQKEGGKEGGKKVEKKAEKKAEKAPKKKRATRKKVVAEVRLKAFWGVFNQSLKRVALYEYSQRRQADKRAVELTEKSSSPHFVQLVKEEIEPE